MNCCSYLALIAPISQDMGLHFQSMEDIGT